MLSRAIKKVYRFLKWHYFIKSNGYDISKKYYVLKYGIGDTYLVSTLLPYLSQKEKAVLLIEKANQAFIPLMFDESVEVKQVDNLPYELISEFGNRRNGEPIVLHSDWIRDVALSSLLSYKGFTLLDVYKLMLGLDFSVAPKFPKNDLTISAELLSRVGGYKNLVLLCPQANSIATVEPGFWIELANFLKQDGFEPVFMNASYSRGFDTIDFPLNESIPLCNNIKGVVSLRSGFCDLISSCSAAKVILYPKIQWYSGSLLQGASLNGMGLSKDKLLELEVSDFTNTSLFFNQIKKFLNE